MENVERKRERTFLEPFAARAGMGKRAAWELHCIDGAQTLGLGPSLGRISNFNSHAILFLYVHLVWMASKAPVHRHDTLRSPTERARRFARSRARISQRLPARAAGTPGGLKRNTGPIGAIFKIPIEVCPSFRIRRLLLTLCSRDLLPLL